jgi:hypothetical protein
MKRISFNIPTTDGVETREGYRIWLRYGNLRRAFVLQLVGDRPCVLADHASGYKLADLASRMLRNYVANPYRHDRSLAGWRREAQAWLNEAIREKGHVAVHEKLNSVPRIN